MSEDRYGIHNVMGAENKNRKLDIVFIHGLGGHLETTWGNLDDDFWPQWLGEDFCDSAVWSIGYDASPSTWCRDTMSMEKRALNMIDELHTKDGIGDKPIFFIVHSMGGLILKYILERANLDNKYKLIKKYTKGIAFLATPHEGSFGATFLTRLNIIFRVTPIVEQLQKNSYSLDRLDEIFTRIVEQDSLKCITFYETKEVRLERTFLKYKGIQVVSESSAKGRFIQDTPLPVDKDHINICKLNSRDDLIYRNIEIILRDILSDIKKENEKDSKYKEIENSLPEKVEEKTSLTNQIFLLFYEDDISTTKYEVVGYVQDEDEFESNLIEYTFENIDDEIEQEKFIEMIRDISELDNVPIHFVIPPSLFLKNFKQWKYQGIELVKMYHILLHNKEKFTRKVSRFKIMINDWDNLFAELKDSSIEKALTTVKNEREKFDSRDNKMGVCFEYHSRDCSSIKNTLIGANVGLWQYSTGSIKDYKEWLNQSILLNELDLESRKCDHMALIWDDMSLLENLKRKI